MTRDRSAFLGVMALSVALNATAIWWGLPSRFAWAPDELQPPIILQGIDERFSGDWHQPAYPPFHYYLLATSYLPVLALDLVDVDGVSGRTLFYCLGRFISLAMGVGIVVTIYRLGLELFDRRAALFASLATAFVAPFAYYAKIANLDVPAAFWVSLSLYFFIRFVKRDETRDLLAFAATAVIATCTKDQAYAFYVLPVLFLLVRRRRSGLPIVDRRFLVAGGAAIGLFLAIHNVVFNFQGFVHHFEEILWARSHYSSFESTPIDQMSLFRQTLRHMQFSLGWPMTVASVLGVGLVVRERRIRPLPLWVVAFAVSYYVFFIAPVRSTWLRYALPLAIVSALFAGRGLAWLWQRRTLWFRAGVLAALGYSLLYATSVDVLLLEDSRYDVERWLHARVRPGDVVGFVGPEYYLPRLDGLPAKRVRPTASVLERARPKYLVVNPDYASRFAPGTREGELLESLATGRAGYGLALRHQSRPRFTLLDFDGVQGNMAKINPVIEVYELAE